MHNKLGRAAEQKWSGASCETAAVDAAIASIVALRCALRYCAAAMADDAKAEGCGINVLIAGVEAMPAANRHGERPKDNARPSAAARHISHEPHD